jgi:hypothetical protein
MTDARVVALRHRLAASSDLAGDEAESPHFDLPVETVVQRFQSTKNRAMPGFLLSLTPEAGQ